MTMKDRIRRDVKPGGQVYAENGRVIGTIDRLDNNGFYVRNRHYPFTDVDRVDAGQVYLKRSGLAAERAVGAGRVDVRDTDRETHIPVVEEHLEVDKRRGDLGEVDVHKRVTEERVSVPVDLTREEVRVREVDVPDRPLRPGDADRAFQEGTIRVPVRGEEAVVHKEPVVTGEVVIDKQQTTEHREVGDTVRKEHVDVDENWRRARDDLRRSFGEHARQAGGPTRTFQEVEPHYRTGFMAGTDRRFAGRRFEEVEPELRRDYESRWRTGMDPWERLREQVREGFEHARR